MPTARYDGQTAWYEEIASPEAVLSARASAVQMLGSGPGRCLDLGCGTGRAIPALKAAGWTVVGTDISIDQLEAARQRTGEPAEHLVRADAHALPFEDGEFDAVISIFTHTDLDDVLCAFTEACRVVRRGGVFVYLGAHPCFGSPFVERGREGSPPILHAGYRAAGWQRLERGREQREDSGACRNQPPSARRTRERDRPERLHDQAVRGTWRCRPSFVSGDQDDEALAGALR